MSNALTPIKKTLTGDYFRKQVALCLPKHMTPDRFVRVALTALTRVPKLAQCTEASLIKCMLTCSELGLEPDGRLAHLIPYGKDCTLVIDYKGLAELAMRSGKPAIGLPSCSTATTVKSGSVTYSVKRTIRFRLNVALA